ncbi:hypothetical protein DEU56DRAFT_916696 [Suillus clintonianus]|uniref:uncharacterized protein n=1 Tax=Suillus clintonianus TaxID=1904413 RepID=UPI001B85F8FB|nr:uncharacterized protein DEU56DRAFT_916696 [Suillus clintonianus]KAG2125088.1 hypothetical protein DEU56DRAFT_916696 [Suillus clintonianus]
MAPAEHSKTVDFGVKLASLLSAPRISDVPTLDKLTDLELNQLIVEEEEPTNGDQPRTLSHMLSRIFRTFTLEVPDVTDLQVPLHKIRYRDTRLRNKFAHLDEQSMVPLYDTETSRWNWALPKCHRESNIIQLPDIEEGGDGEENSGANEESGSGGTTGEDPSTQLEEPPWELEIPNLRPSTSTQKRLPQAEVHGSAEGPIEDKTIIDAPESDLEMDVDVEMSSDSEEILPPDPPQLEIPQDPLRASFSDPIGRIRVKNHTYDILEVIFSSQGLVGRGTVCYLARRDDEEYIIKDYWVLGGKDDALNEVEMLREMQGVRGVPKLVEYWLVKIAPNEVWGSIKGTSRTHVRLVLKPRARPLHAFQTKLELVSALQDIVRVQQIAVEDCGVLHRDCSLNNSMIEDDGNRTNGLLIDWEFAVHITAGQKYTIGGTGTIPFMSHSLLWQLSEAVGDLPTSARSWKVKVASPSLSKPPPLILHHYQDDLESLFYVFVCICIEYRGPLGVKCDLSVNRKQEWLPHLWSTNTLKAGSNAKTSFFFHPNADKLKKQFHPNKGPSGVVTFQEVLDLLETYLAELPKDEPSPELLFAKKVIVALPKKRSVSEAEGDDRDDHLNKPPITERNITHSRWTMEPIPQPKRSRTT